MGITLLKANDRFFLHLFAWGATAHSNGDFTVDREFYRQMRESYDYLVNSDDRPPQYPPIQKRHSDDGFTYGLIVDLYSTDEKQPPAGFSSEGIYIEVAPSAPLKRWIDDGLVTNWSPGFSMSWTCPHTGRELINVLRECSFVSDGHLKNTEKQYRAYALASEGVVYHLEEKMEEKEMKEKEMEDEAVGDMSDRLGALEEGMASLGEALARLTAMLGDEDEHDNEEEAEMGEHDRDMSARLASLEKSLADEREKRLKAEAAQKIADAGVELSSQERGALVQLSVDQPEAFVSTLQIVANRDKKIRELSASKSNPYDLGAEVGQVGQVETDKSEDDGFRALCAELKESGLSQHDAIRELGSRKAINFMDQDDAGRKFKIVDAVFGG